MADFRVGDRVRCVNKDAPQVFGQEGTILLFPRAYDRWWVEFDKNTGGANAEGRGKQGHCWCVPSKDMVVVPPLSPFDAAVRAYITLELNNG